MNTENVTGRIHSSDPPKMSFSSVVSVNTGRDRFYGKLIQIYPLPRLPIRLRRRGWSLLDEKHVEICPRFVLRRFSSRVSGENSTDRAGTTCRAKAKHWDNIMAFTWPLARPYLNLKEQG